MSHRVLRDEQPLPDSEPEEQLFNFIIDINIDGVQVFNNSEQAEVIPILAVIYAIKQSADSTKPPVVIQLRHPFVIGFFLGKCKPNLDQFLAPLFLELKRLCPNNVNPDVTRGREFTASLRCVIADYPMRSYLKRCKGHSGYWSCERCIQEGESIVNPGKKKGKIQMRELNAPLRVDKDYITYRISPDSSDDHVHQNCEDTPFFQFGFGCVSGFAIDPMHTMHAGAFGRRMKGIAFVKAEGQLSKELLTIVNHRILMFQQCKTSDFERVLRPLTTSVRKYKHHELRNMMMYYLFPVFSGLLPNDHLENVLLLQFAMLLLGGFDPNPVSKCDIDEASKILKLYVQQLMNFGFPIRPTTHAIIHLPEDVANFCCGSECLSA